MSSGWLMRSTGWRPPLAHDSVMRVSRPPLVLLHGWGMTPRVWDGLRDRLGAAFDIIAPALPGHLSAPLPEQAQLEAWADAVAPALPDGALICGWSLGAMLALAIAVRHPEKASRLALTGATAHFVADAGWPQGLLADTVAAFVHGFAEAPAPTLRRFLSLQTQGDSQRKQVQAALAAALARATDADADTDRRLGVGLDVLSRADLRPVLAALRQPVLLIHGEGDALMPLDAARHLAQTLPHARLQVCAGVGHAPFLSDVDGFARDLLAFADG